MHTLSATLAAAQRSSSARPAVKVVLANTWGGVTQLRWERLYSGSEPDTFHAAAISGRDGALLRARYDPTPRALRYQRIASPDAESGFGTWQQLASPSTAAGIALAASGSQVMLFDVGSFGRHVRVRESTDDGVTFGGPVRVTVAGSSVLWQAADFSSTGVATLFFATATTLYVTRKAAAGWTAPAVWPHSLKSITGIACCYVKGDWRLLVCGTGPDDAPGVWSCLFGDGAGQAAGTWSPLREVITAAPDSGVVYQSPSLDNPDGPRASMVERYTGAGAYTQTLMTYPPAGAEFADNRWREPAPVNLTAAHGAALASDTRHVWLSTPSDVWRAPLGPHEVDVSDDVIAADVHETPTGGSARIELDNGAGRYVTETGGVLRLGAEVRVSWGHETVAGAEVSTAHRYWVNAVRREARAGRAVTVVEAEDGWWFLRAIRSRRQITWPAHTASVHTILSQLMTMAGLTVKIAESSPAIVATYPAITLSPNQSLADAIERIIARVPDMLRFSDNAVEAIHAQPADKPSYSYGTGHPVLAAHDLSVLPAVNRVQVYGAGVIGEDVRWPAVEAAGDLLVQVVDQSLTTAEAADTRATAELRRHAVLPPRGRITVAVNAGQQLYDVVTVTMPELGWDGAAFRVMGLRTRYARGGPRPVYAQDIDLGGV